MSKKNILTLDLVDNFELIAKKDENGRDIKLFTFNNTFFTGNSEYYPDILFNVENQPDLILPIKEMSMSLNKKSYYEETGLKYIEKNENEDYDKINDEVYFFIYNTSNYYHFIYDTLPHLYLYLKLKERNKNLKLLINFNKNQNNILPFVIEVYQLLNITDKDIIIHNKKNKYKKVYLSNSFTHDGLSNLPPRKEIYEIYDKLIKNSLIDYKSDNKYDKIYISRRTWMNKHTNNIGTDYTTRRKLTNENELVDKLVNLGFIEIFGENYSMKEKIQIFNSAKYVIGAIGGTITSTVFCSKNCKIITMVSPCFLDINYRMKYLLKNSDFVYGKLDCKEGEIPKNVRVKITNPNHDYYNCICEIVEKIDDKYLLNVGNNYISFNNDDKFKQILLDENNFVKLDNGINSPWKINLNLFDNNSYSFNNA